MRAITVMIKPASSMCNLRCAYCFYVEDSAHRREPVKGIMTRETAQLVISRILEYSAGGPVGFCFQGGEPLIAGKEFFFHFVEDVKHLNIHKSQVSYALQTNGTLLDEELCIFLAKEKFLVGISLDGKCDLHNFNRKTAAGKESFQQVMRGIALLNTHKVQYNVLAVVTKQMCNSAYGTLHFFLKHNMRYLQFTTCMEPKDVPLFSTYLAPNNEEYAKFYCQLFDLYIGELRKGNFLSIRYFDNILAMLHGEHPEQCGMFGYCPGQLVIEADGSAYPCDFYCEDQWLMGNLCTNTVEEIQNSCVMKKFQTSSMVINNMCRGCKVAKLCRGGCRREKDYRLDGVMRENIYCEGRKKFFEHVLEKMGLNDPNLI